MNYLPLIILIGLALLFFYFFKKPKEKETAQKNKTPRSLHKWEKGLTTLWSGSSITITFDYEARNDELTRRKVDIARVSQAKNGDIYLHGYCHLRKEERSFNTYNIYTDILDGDHYYELFTWLDEKLGIDNV